MNILQVCAYAAEYEGNFMKSLYSLENKLNSMGHNVYYAFPEKTKEMLWCQNLEKRTKVFYLPLRMARIKPSTYLYLRNVIKENEIKLVHSHFELYDLPLAMVCKDVKMVWHIHDAIQNHYSRANISRRILYKLHYSVFSKKANVISVSNKHLDFVKSLGLKSPSYKVILNGTDLQRIKKVDFNKKKKFDFLIFAWEFERKGGPLVLEAAQILEDAGYKFVIAFVGNEDTWSKELVKNYINKSWLFKQDFVEDVNVLYDNTKCFLHVSLAEGCSYALEESIYTGLPIICSDIEENQFSFDFPTVHVVKNNDAYSTADAMKKLIDSNFEQDDNIIEQSRELLKNNYSIDSWSNKIIDYYREIGGI